MFKTSLALAVTVLLAALVPFGTVLSAEISIRVSPASIVAAVRDGDIIGPVTVTNSGDSTIDVEGHVEEGGHDEEGIPVCRPFVSPPARAVFITLEPTQFRLLPGASRAVRATVHVTPGFSGGAYPVVLFRGSPAAGGRDRQLGVAPQVAVLTFLAVAPRRSGEVQAKPALISLGVVQDAPGGAVRVLATCENTGNMHANLAGAVIVRRQDGRVAAEAAMPPCVCLPGYRRTLVGSVAGACLESGAYVAEVRLHSPGGETESALIAFRSDDGHRVASAHLDLRSPGPGGPPDGRSNAPRIAKVNVPAVSPGWELPLEVCLENLNESALDPLGYLEIWDYQMKRVGLVALGGTRVAPGGLAVIRLTWPEVLPPGYYTARATLQWGDERRSASTAFVVGGNASRHGG